MRRSLSSIHVVALALWLGALVFSFLLAKTLFDSAKPVCPVCLKTTAAAGDGLASCATCGALHHGACAPGGCGLEHDGSHVLGIPSSVAIVSTTGLAEWGRVKVKEEKIVPERRLLWRLDATSNAHKPEDGEVRGACFEVPRAAVGDSLARAFQLSQALAVGMALASLLTVLLTPPGGALRLLRALALGAALALAIASLNMGREIGTQRLLRESNVVPSAEAVAEFKKTHGYSSMAGVAEALLVLVGLVLSLERRSEPTPPAP